MYDKNTVLAFIDALKFGHLPNTKDECVFDCNIYHVYETGCPFKERCEQDRPVACIMKREDLRSAYQLYVAKYNPDIPIELKINDILVLKQFVDDPVDAMKALPNDNIIPVLRKIVKESALWEDNDKE